MSTMTKNLKPTNDFSNISFKYVCSECQCDHWFFLSDLQIEGGYRTACDVCQNILEPDPVDTVEIIYKHRPAATKVEMVESVLQEGLNTMTLNACKHTLRPFGYNDTAIEDMIQQSYEYVKDNDVTALVKYALEKFGG